MKSKLYTIAILTFLKLFVGYSKKEGYNITGYITSYKDGTKVKLITFNP